MFPDTAKFVQTAVRVNQHKPNTNPSNHYSFILGFTNPYLYDTVLDIDGIKNTIALYSIDIIKVLPYVFIPVVNQ